MATKCPRYEIKIIYNVQKNPSDRESFYRWIFCIKHIVDNMLIYKFLMNIVDRGIILL